MKVVDSHIQILLKRGQAPTGRDAGIENCIFRLSVAPIMQSGDGDD